MRAFVIALISFASIPTALAQDGLILGTEDLPELPDQVGDVQYDPLYTGPRDHAYVDLVAAWFEHEATTDMITVTIKVTDATALSQQLAGWWPSCRLKGILTDDGVTSGVLEMAWSHYPNGTYGQYASFRPDDAQTPGVINGRPIDHTYSEILTAPGYFRFGFARSTLLQLGSQFENPEALCQELYAPHAGNAYIGPALAPIYTNRDDGASQAAYSFAELRRARGPDGARDPIEALPAESSDSAPVMVSEPTPSPGFLTVLALAGLVVAAVFRVRRIL